MRGGQYHSDKNRSVQFGCRSGLQSGPDQRRRRRLSRSGRRRPTAGVPDQGAGGPWRRRRRSRTQREDESYMAEAIGEARRGAEKERGAAGSVAVLDDAMIARDHDRSQNDDDPTAHAVMLTIRAAARKLGTRRLSDVTIFTTNEPCPMCVGALLNARYGHWSSPFRTRSAGVRALSSSSRATSRCRTRSRSSPACARPRRDAWRTERAHRPRRLPDAIATPSGPLVDSPGGERCPSG